MGSMRVEWARLRMVSTGESHLRMRRNGWLTVDLALSSAITANRIRTFLDSSRTQLTPTGLAGLSASLEPQEVVAFFRNSHLSVLYKRPSTNPFTPDQSEPVLFSLVTDESFRAEPEVVWEPLFASVTQSTGFVNSEFTQASTAGGDVAGMTAEEVARQADQQESAARGGDDE